MKDWTALTDKELRDACRDAPEMEKLTIPDRLAAQIEWAKRNNCTYSPPEPPIVP